MRCLGGPTILQRLTVTYRESKTLQPHNRLKIPGSFSILPRAQDPPCPYIKTHLRKDKDGRLNSENLNINLKAITTN